MIIKKYLKFLKENKDSIGEWVETHYEKHDYVKNIVNRYIKDIDPEIRLANAVNLLKDNEKQEIKTQIENYLEKGIEDKDVDITTTVDISESIVNGEVTKVGKGVFRSFLKSLIALSQKETSSNWSKTPVDFLYYYHFDNLDSNDVKTIFKRFKSLSRYLDLIDYGKNELDLYFGVKVDAYFEYGIRYEDNLIPIGQFKLGARTIRWILNLNARIVKDIKKNLVNLSYKDIIILGKIKSDIKNFDPGYFKSKSNIQVKDDILMIGYYGYGKWESGKIDNNELVKFKSKLSKFILSKKWGKKVLISIKPNSFWVIVNIKLK